MRVAAPTGSFDGISPSAPLMVALEATVWGSVSRITLQRQSVGHAKKACIAPERAVTRAFTSGRAWSLPKPISYDHTNTLIMIDLCSCEGFNRVAWFCETLLLAFSRPSALWDHSWWWETCSREGREQSWRAQAALLHSGGHLQPKCELESVFTVQADSHDMVLWRVAARTGTY